MSNLNIIERYNSIYTNIKNMNIEDTSAIFDEVKAFYFDCKSVDITSAKSIVKMFTEKFEQMLSDMENKCNRVYEKLKKVKNECYDFSGEKNDSEAVSMMMLQLMGQLPKTKTKANTALISAKIENAIQSGTVGAKAVLALTQYPTYVDMVTEHQKAKAVERSKSTAQIAFEHAMSVSQEEYGKQWAELYQKGYRLRQIKKRVDSFIRAIHNEEIVAMSKEKFSYWG